MPVQNRKFDYYYLDAINFCDDLFMFFFFLVLFRSLWPATLLKMRLWHRCFLVSFAKFPNTLFLFYFKKIRMRRLLSTNSISTGIRTTFYQFCGSIFSNKHQEVLRRLILANLAKFSKSSKMSPNKVLYLPIVFILSVFLYLFKFHQMQLALLFFLTI